MQPRASVLRKQLAHGLPVDSAAQLALVLQSPILIHLVVVQHNKPLLLLLLEVVALVPLLPRPLSVQQEEPQKRWALNR